ncbi:protein kinase domain-containing protein [Ilyonectria robusta]
MPKLPNLPITSLLPPPIEVARVKRFIDKHATYTAVVYEFVQTGPNDPDAAQAVLDFLWRVGFAHVPATKADNWEGGVLLDHSDIVHCNGHGWDTRLFGYRRVDQILREPAFDQVAGIPERYISVYHIHPRWVSNGWMCANEPDVGLTGPHHEYAGKPLHCRWPGLH